MSGPHDLPPGRIRRGRYLLAGKIKPEDAHPTELAYATRHVLTHQSLEADAFRRTREAVALAELRQTLGPAPWSHFGSAALSALVVAGGTGECLRCRANLIARARGLSPPYRDEATNFLLGGEEGGCVRCRPSGRSTPVRASARGGTGRPARTTRRRPLALLRDDVNRLLTEVGDGDPLRLPSLYGEPVHPTLR